MPPGGYIEACCEVRVLRSRTINIILDASSHDGISHHVMSPPVLPPYPSTSLPLASALVLRPYTIILIYRLKLSPSASTLTLHPQPPPSPSTLSLHPCPSPLPSTLTHHPYPPLLPCTDQER
jgi:hypothetical protein